MHELIESARRLTDDALLASALGLVGRERRLTASLIAHLAEMAARGLAQRQGHPSLFEYCRRELGFSESEAWARVEAANAARRFPLLLDLLLVNQLTMTSAARLARHLTPENHEELLRAACGKSKEQVLALVATLAPKPSPPALMRAVTAGVARPPVVLSTPKVASPVRPPTPCGAPPPPPAAVLPLAPDRFRYHVTIDTETRELLTAARDLSSHRGRGDEELLKQALRLLVDDLARRKAQLTERPRPVPALRDEHSRHVPAAVKRHVWRRDGGRCVYVGPGGHRCDTRRRLEFHHVKPYAAGGEATEQNIQLRCRAHNQYEARTFFTRDPEASSVRTDSSWPGAGGTGYLCRP